MTVPTIFLTLTTRDTTNDRVTPTNRQIEPPPPLEKESAQNRRERHPKKGSAIFTHITKKNYKKTAGCIALKKSDLVLLIKEINKNTKVIIN